MRAWLDRLFQGRQGMDELSKALFWGGLAGLLLSGVVLAFLSVGLGSILNWLGLFALIWSFIRAFSRRLAQREAENLLFLRWLGGRRRSFAAFRDRLRQRKEYRFFKCPSCKTWLRVPKGKGHVDIRCKCGYELHRKT